MEVIDSLLFKKLKSADTLIEKIGDGEKKESLQQMLRLIEDSYFMDVGHLFLMKRSEQLSEFANNEYKRLVSKNNYANQVDALSKAVKSVLVSEHKRIEIIYPDEPIANPIDSHNIELCVPCNSTMQVDSIKSELCCTKCGRLVRLEGTAFETMHTNHEITKMRPGVFNPNEHFMFWWTHILAREPDEEIGNKDDPENMYGEKLLAKITNIIKRKKIILQYATIYDIRLILKELKLTRYNKNVPLILKKITNIGPPQLSEAYAIKAENLFSKAIEINEHVKDQDNRKYYPYYIYKILEHILPVEDTESRRVLHYIYNQSNSTVEANDLIWQKICLQLEEIKYVPTDRTKFRVL